MTFGASRGLPPHVKNIKAAVLLAHGLNDYNVTPDHSVRIYNEMKARGLPVSMYLHQGGHGGNPPADMLNRPVSLLSVRRGQRRGERSAGLHRAGCRGAVASDRTGRRASGRSRSPRRSAHTVRIVPGAGFDAGVLVPVGRRQRNRVAGVRRDEILPEKLTDDAG